MHTQPHCHHPIPILFYLVVNHKQGIHHLLEYDIIAMNQILIDHGD